jgi:hypothetical protein
VLHATGNDEQAVLVADNSNPFEVACAIEVFGGGPPCTAGFRPSWA